MTATPNGSWAQSPSNPPSDSPDEAQAARERARQLAEEGAEAFDAGDYSTALGKLEQAEALVPVPTIGIAVARTLVKLDRLRDASAAYARVEAMVLPDEMPERFKQVQRQRQAAAKRERESLVAEMPRIELVTVGKAPEHLRLDGAVIALEGRSTTVEVDPGRHEVVARRGAERFKQEVRAIRRSKVVVELRFGDRLALPVPATPPDSNADGGPWPILVPVGWTAIGLGAASLVAGGVTYARAAALQDDLDAQCPGGQCRSSQAGFAVEDDIATYDAFRTASIATFAIGAGLAVVGTGLVVAPLLVPESSEAPEASLGMGPGSVELTVTF